MFAPFYYYFIKNYPFSFRKTIASLIKSSQRSCNTKPKILSYAHFDVQEAFNKRDIQKIFMKRF